MNYYLTVTISLCLLSLITRALPFFFGKWMTPRLNQLGKLLPAYIMLLLVLYEVGLDKLTTPPFAWPALSALGILTLVHLWRRNALITIALGTISYLILTHFFS